MLRAAIAGNLLWSTFGRMTTALSPLLLVPMMIGTWGLPLYGEWLILTAIPAYVMFAPDMGLGGAVANEMAASGARQNFDRAANLYRSSLVLLSIAGTFFGVVVGVAGLLIDWRAIGISHIGTIDVFWILVNSSFQILLSQQAALISGIYKAVRRNPRYAAMQTFGMALPVVLGVAVLLKGGRPVDYVFVATAVKVAFLGILLVDAYRIAPAIRLRFGAVSVAEVRPYFAPGLGHAALPLINAMQNQGVIVFVGILLGSSSVAAFQAMRTLSNGVRSVISLPSAAVGAELSSLLAERRDDTVMRLVVRNTQIAVGVAATALICAALWGEPGYRLWLRGGAPYVPAVLLALFVSQIPCAIGSSFTVLLIAANEIHLAITRLGAVAVLSLGVVIVGSSVLGMSGAAIGVIVWEAGIALVVLIIAFKRPNFDRSVFWRDFVDLRSLRAETTAARDWIKSSALRRIRKASP